MKSLLPGAIVDKLGRISDHAKQIRRNNPVKEPFFKWLKTLPDPPDVSKDIMNHDTTAYLLPAIIYDSEEAELLQQFYDLIFEEQLNGWWTEQSDWPKKRDLTTFKKWFDLEFHSLVLDLVDAPLQDD